MSAAKSSGCPIRKFQSRLYPRCRDPTMPFLVRFRLKAMQNVRREIERGWESADRTANPAAEEPRENPSTGHRNLPITTRHAFKSLSGIPADLNCAPQRRSPANS